MSDTLSARRYEPVHIDLDDKNNSQRWLIEMTGKNKQVLEVGTSTGYVTRVLRDNGNSITGIEVDKDAGEAAAQYCKRMIIGDIESLDLDECMGDEQFDVIIFGDVLEHLKDPARALEKVKSYMKPDGYLVVSIPNACHGDIILRLMSGDFKYTPQGLLDSTHIRFFGFKNISELFIGQGFAIEDVHKIIVPPCTTELKVESVDTSGDLFKFINSLPDSGVYQFVFKAVPTLNADVVVIPHALTGPMLDAHLHDVVKMHMEILESENVELKAARREADNDLAESEKRAQGFYNKFREADARSMFLERELDDIRNSIVWRTIALYHNGIVERLLPMGKRRRAAYDLMLRSGKVVANKGFGSLFSKALERSKKRAANKNDYGIWISKNEPTPSKLKQYARESRDFRYRPLISIVTPVFDPEVYWIKAAIDSVLAQAYDRWELCLADASTKEDVKACLKEYAGRDTRIKIKFLAENKGISGNTNEAMAMAGGEFVGLLDHDDMLSPDALYEIVKLLQADPDADMIYSDEDKIDLKNNRFEPYFKPDWSPDMFLSCMYTCHFGVYRKSIIDELGGFREGYNGSQDYDLVLRFIERTGAIKHIPKILYHWRAVPGSAAYSADAKKYAYVSAKKALSDYMQRNGIEGKVMDGAWTGSYRIQRDLVSTPSVSIIIPTRDKPDVLKKCVDSILGKTCYLHYEIVIVNNGSDLKKTYDYFNELKAIANVRIIDYNEEFNFSAINNYAARQASGEVLLFLNNDMEVISGEWLSAMLEHVQRKEVGAVGGKLLYPNNTIQHAGAILGLTGGSDVGVAGHWHKHHPADSHGYFGRSHIIQDLSCVTAACMMIRKEIFNELGGFDENIAVAFNDVELCIRIRQQGYLIVYTPYALLYHHESLSRGYEDSPEKQARFAREVKYVRDKWGSVIDSGDPYYSPNLALDNEDYSIRI